MEPIEFKEQTVVRVLHIAKAFGSGGAGIAAQRIAEKEGADTLSEKDYFMGGLLGKVIYVVEKMYVWRRLRERKYLHYFSLPLFGRGVTRKRKFRKADRVVLHWVSGGFLSLREIERIIDRKPTKIVLHDMWYFTGGCHYSRSCVNYLGGCHTCWYMKYTWDPHAANITRRYQTRKIKILQHPNVTVVAPSNWLREKAEKVIKKPVGLERNPSIMPKKYILFVGNTDNPYKGFNTALRFINELRKRLPNAELLVAGKHKGGSYNGVQFLGSVKDMRTVYKRADITLVPSQEDNYPNVIQESLAYGIPVIASDVGGIPEMRPSLCTSNLLLEGVNYAMQVL